MMIKKSPKEVIESAGYPSKYIPSTITAIYGPKNHEKAWEREMRNRLMALEQRLDDIEELITDLHPKELGVKDGSL